MRRILLVVAVGAIMVLSSVSYAFAYANPGNEGNGSSAPGQSNAQANCADTIERQAPKAPTNCGHPGLIPLP
jgi:hypothetical protein